MCPINIRDYLVWHKCEWPCHLSLLLIHNSSIIMKSAIKQKESTSKWMTVSSFGVHLKIRIAANKLICHYMGGARSVLILKCVNTRFAHALVGSYWLCSFDWYIAWPLWNRLIPHCLTCCLHFWNEPRRIWTNNPKLIFFFIFLFSNVWSSC